MPKLQPRPDWPGGKEPINGGLLYVMLVGALVVIGLVVGLVWGVGRLVGAW